MILDIRFSSVSPKQAKIMMANSGEIRKENKNHPNLLRPRLLAMLTGIILIAIYKKRITIAKRAAKSKAPSILLIGKDKQP
jgi:hypothetical protein